MRSWAHLQALSSTFDVDLLHLRFAVQGHQGGTPSTSELERLCRDVTVLEVNQNRARRNGRLARMPSVFGRALRFLVNLVEKPMQVPGLEAGDRQKLREILSDQTYDALFVVRLRFADVISVDALDSCLRGGPRVLDLDDIESIASRRLVTAHWENSGGLWPLGRFLQAMRVAAAERRLTRLFDRVLICSEQDQETLESRYPGVSGAVVPNSIEMPPKAFYEPARAPSQILFVGSLNYAPNEQAVRYFVETVMPALEEKLSGDGDDGFEFVVVGGEASKGLLALGAHPRVRFEGFVPDLSKFYRRAALAVAPILAGGGTRIKIIEALAHVCPVVSTSIGAEGLDLRDGEALLLCDDQHSFAGACHRLLRDEDEARRLAESGRAAVESTYSRQAAGRRLLKVFGDLMSAT